MQINTLAPLVQSSTDLGSSGLQADQGKTAQGAAQPTQIEDAVKPAGEGEEVSGDDTLAANRQGRGKLVDIKV